MEAAVLKLALMPEVDCNSNSLNAELEVKKLQELVRKLERQNEQLRTRASCCAAEPRALPPSAPCALGGGGGLRLPSPLPALLCQAPVGPFAPPEDPFDYFHPHGGDGAEAEDGADASLLDELELLDLDYLCSLDESDETWLYSSSKSAESSDGSLTPLQWCRQVLDSPKSEVEAARRSLSLRLDQVSRWRSSLSSPSPSSSPGPPLSRVAGVSPISAPPSAKPCSTPQLSERHAPSLSSPLHPVLHRTLSPVGKELSPVAERTPTFLPHPAKRSRSLRCSALSPQSSVDSDLGASEAEDDSIALGYKLQDLTDVQVMARLQEESLRQDYASTTSVLANRRSQSFSFQLSQLSAGPDLEEEDEEDDEDYGLLPPPQPRLTRLPHSHTFSSVRDWRRSTSSLCTPPSTPSTPPYPSAGFAFQPLPQTQHQGLGLGSLCGAELQGLRPGSAEYENKLRRSMPNLRPGSTAVLHPLPRPAAKQGSECGQLLLDVTAAAKATAYVSPTIKGSASMPTSTSLQSLSSSSSSCGSNLGLGGSSIPLLSKPPGGAGTPTPTAPRSGLPRPASFVGVTSSTPRNKVAQPARSLLTPPKSLSTLSALRDSAWRDGCY
ncbi:hypothetical protein Q5P01_005795 [Channa striata]|uniref:SLAIN motif-containing protein 1 n=1 Tax=Channa striata TaxID=64152 RepID=A0AA88NJC9_CHASR|nr:hypothetical protein Q5P01_005795 [Channa striata]